MTGFSWQMEHSLWIDAIKGEINVNLTNEEIEENEKGPKVRVYFNDEEWVRKTYPVEN